MSPEQEIQDCHAVLDELGVPREHPDVPNFPYTVVERLRIFKKREVEQQPVSLPHEEIQTPDDHAAYIAANLEITGVGTDD